jgi:hypothetical protein
MSDFSQHVVRTRYLEKIASEHHRNARPRGIGIYAPLITGYTKEEFQAAMAWDGIQDAITEREESLEHCWEVEPSLIKSKVKGASG